MNYVQYKLICVCLNPIHLYLYCETMFAYKCFAHCNYELGFTKPEYYRSTSIPNCDKCRNVFVQLAQKSLTDRERIKLTLVEHFGTQKPVYLCVWSVNYMPPNTVVYSALGRFLSIYTTSPRNRTGQSCS